MAFKVLSKSSAGPKPKDENKSIFDILDTYYKTIFIKILHPDIDTANEEAINNVKFDACNLRYILSESATEMTTCITNNIKMHFFNHLKRFVNESFSIKDKFDDSQKSLYYEANKKLKLELYKVKNDLLNTTTETVDFTSDIKYHTWITNIKKLILPTTTESSYEHDIDITPCKYLKHMIYMSLYLENAGKKTFQFFPLRTQIIPKYININTNALVDIMVKKNKNNLFNNIHNEQQNIWNKYFNLNDVKLKDHTFDFQIKTDGFAISALFISNEECIKKNKKKECFRTGREKTAEMKNEKSEEIVQEYIKNKKELLEKKKNENKLKNRENAKKKKEEFKKLPKDEQKRIIAERKLKAEFVYIEEMVKYDTKREQLKSQLDKQLLVYGDPGKRSPLYLLGENGEYFNYTNRMRVHETKRLKYTTLINNKKKKTFVDDKTVEQIETELSIHNSKTCILANYEKYIKKKISINAILKPIYVNNYFRKLNWFSYLNTRKHESNLMNKLKETFGRKENNEEIQKRLQLLTEQNVKYSPMRHIRDKDRTPRVVENPIFIIGDWNDKQGLKFMSTPGIGLKRRLAENFTVLTIDEYNTSKLHYKHEVTCENYKASYETICKEDNTVRNGNQSIHSILIYKLETKESGCINRDKNSVLNMKKIVRNLIETQERPEKYKRTCKPLLQGVNCEQPPLINIIKLKSVEEGTYRVVKKLKSNKSSIEK